MQMRTRNRPVIAIGLGLGLSVLGAFLISSSGGLNEIQTATSATSFSDAAHEQGNQLRSAIWTDVHIFVPGYVLLLGGIVALLRRTGGVSRRIRLLSSTGFAALLLGALADELENIFVRIGTGNVDLNASDPTRIVSPSESLINALQVASTVKFAFLAMAVAVIAVLAIDGLRRRVRQNTSANSGND
jgi:hypothetical protein